jgi:hypothetical protein
VEQDQSIRTGATASVIAHLSVLALLLLSTEVHPFDSAPESIAVGIVTSQEAEHQTVEPPPQQVQLPPPDLSLLEQKAAPAPVPAPAPAPAAEPVKPQQMAAAATPAGGANAQMATRGGSSPGYKPAEPDLSIKYNVLLGLPPELPAPVAEPGKSEEGFDVESKPADLTARVVADFRRHLKSCSKLPSSVASSDHIIVKLRVFMTPDGRLAAEPAIGGGSANVKAIELLHSAIAALKACQPFTMFPPDHYDEWKVLDLDFMPRDFSG